ncbi:MAG: hypothetical protein AB1715_06285, partial [Acidobacteriota bacterium]
MRAFAFCLLASLVLLGAFLEPGTSAPGQEKPVVLAFDPRPRQALGYSFESRMNSEGRGFLGKSLTLTVLAEGGVDFFIRQVSSESVYADLSSPGIRVVLQALGSQDEFTL